MPGIEVHVLVPGTAAHPGQMRAEGDLQVPGAVRVEHRPAPVTAQPLVASQTERGVVAVLRERDLILSELAVGGARARGANQQRRRGGDHPHDPNQS